MNAQSYHRSGGDASGFRIHVDISDGEAVVLREMLHQHRVPAIAGCDQIARTLVDAINEGLDR